MAKKTSIEHYNEALTEIRSENRKPVYYFCGEEEFFLDRLQNEVESLMPAEHRDFNFDLIYAREHSPEQVLAIARSYPMMAEQRIVIVRDFLSLNMTSYQRSGSGGGLDDWLPYFDQPNPTTLLVLFDSKKPSGNTRLGKSLKKSPNARLFEFEKAPDYRLADWISEWVRRHHDRRIEPDAAQMLGQYVGGNLQLLSTEIDKVCTYVKGEGTIERGHVKKIIGIYREYNVFELKDAIMARDLDKSLYIAEQMLQQSSSGSGEIIRSAGFFFNLYSNIWQILRLASQGQTKNQIREQMGVSSSWYFNKLWQDASAYKLGEMPLIFEALLDADRAAKGFSKMDDAGIFILLIHRLVGRKNETVSS